MQAATFDVDQPQRRIPLDPERTLAEAGAQ